LSIVRVSDRREGRDFNPFFDGAMVTSKSKIRMDEGKGKRANGSKVMGK
jgi:hypothetical protein